MLALEDKLCFISESNRIVIGPRHIMRNNITKEWTGMTLSCNIEWCETIWHLASGEKGRRWE